MAYYRATVKMTGSDTFVYVRSAYKKSEYPINLEGLDIDELYSLLYPNEHKSQGFQIKGIENLGSQRILKAEDEDSRLEIMLEMIKNNAPKRVGHEWQEIKDDLIKKRKEKVK